MSFWSTIKEIKEGWNRPVPNHYCSRCEGLLVFGLNHKCKGLSAERVRQIVREELAKPTEQNS